MSEQHMTLPSGTLEVSYGDLKISANYTGEKLQESILNKLPGILNAANVHRAKISPQHLDLSISCGSNKASDFISDSCENAIRIFESEKEGAGEIVNQVAQILSE